MKIIGLTGGIAMGKSEVARIFSSLKIPVFNSDFEVHKIIKEDLEIINKIKENFPESYEENNINIKTLSNLVFGNDKNFDILNSIIQPKIKEVIILFIAKSKEEGREIVVLEIPLLFEKKYQELCDYVITVYSSEKTQQARALARPNMTEEKFLYIISKQMNIIEKINKSDFVIYTGVNKTFTKRQVRKFLLRIQNEY